MILKRNCSDVGNSYINIKKKRMGNRWNSQHHEKKDKKQCQDMKQNIGQCIKKLRTKVG